MSVQECTPASHRDSEARGWHGSSGNLVSQVERVILELQRGRARPWLVCQAGDRLRLLAGA